MPLPAVEIVPVRLLPEYWPTAKEILEPAFARSNYTTDEVEALLNTGVMQLWLSAGPVMVTETYQDRMTILLMAGGELTEYMQYFDAFSKIIKPWGFKQLEIVGRPGWQRFFKDKFKVEAVHLRRSL